jgi:hypothetical protein
MSLQNIFQEATSDQALDQAAARFNKLLLIVGKQGVGKTALLNKIAEQKQCTLLNLGLELSKKLLNFTVNDRKLKAFDIISDLFDVQRNSCLAVDNTEIIFDPVLMINPLGLLQSLSRTRLLIWSWNGEIEDGHLSYAYPGHPEYQRIPTSEITLITL